MVEFGRKYDYLLRATSEGTIPTDHKLLTFFSNGIHDGIYSRWASTIRNLNIRIEYIPGPKNTVADGPPRAIFRQSEHLRL